MRRLVLALALAGCVEQPVLEPVANKLDGIYAITSLTENTTSCVPGDPVSIPHTHALALLDPDSRATAREQYFGTFFVFSCSALDTCRNLHSRLLLGQAPSEPSFFVFQGEELGDDAPDTIIEARLAQPLFVDGSCRAGRIDTLIARDGGAFHVSRKTSIVTTYAPDGTDCDLDTAIDLARDAPCEQLELLDADIVEELDD